MRLRNKKTGKIVENAYIRESHDFYNKRTIAVFVRDGNRPPERVSTGYETLAELNAEWEDAPDEPKEHWYVSADGDVRSKPERQFCDPVYMKIIGNYFESEEEAKRAVEELKALKRLRDKGFRFTGYGENDRGYINQIEIYAETDAFIGGKPLDLAEDPDVKLLFGGEE